MHGLQSGQQALTRIAVILAAKGGQIDPVRVGDCVELLEVAARMRATSEVHAYSPLFYQLLPVWTDGVIFRSASRLVVIAMVWTFRSISAISGVALG
ncbi:hypothetical protein [Rhodococcus opacus]|uniref:hypothetical protein n=1 Tax=Rhodococcus opacus TaxID=37919 RepID=UPI001300812D|nr:hypothetical protein [Rhodococcus opacus]